MKMGNAFNNSELLELVEEEIDKVVGGKMDVKKGASRVLAAALSALSLAGGVSTHATEPNGNSAIGNSNESKEQPNPEPVIDIRSQEVLVKDASGFMCNHFNHFKIHSDEFWNEDVRGLLALPAAALSANRTPQLFEQFQLVLNIIFDGNYHFSTEFVRTILDYMDKRLEDTNPITRKEILLYIFQRSSFYCRISNLPEMFNPSQKSLVLNGIKSFCFPNLREEHFMDLPQVQKEYMENRGVRSEVKDRPYDSLLAYISDFDYMQDFMYSTRMFLEFEFPSLLEPSLSNREFEQLANNWKYSHNIEEARNNFYKLVVFLKKSLDPSLFIELMKFCNAYGYKWL